MIPLIDLSLFSILAVKSQRINPEEAYRLSEFQERKNVFTFEKCNSGKMRTANEDRVMLQMVDILR